MAALDVETKASVRVELETQLSAFGGCAIIVTHDPLGSTAGPRYSDMTSVYI